MSIITPNQEELIKALGQVYDVRPINQGGSVQVQVRGFKRMQEHEVVMALAAGVQILQDAGYDPKQVRISLTYKDRASDTWKRMPRIWVNNELQRSRDGGVSPEDVQKAVADALESQMTAFLKKLGITPVAADPDDSNKDGADEVVEGSEGQDQGGESDIPF